MSTTKKKKAKTAWITVDVKDPDGIGDLIDKLGLKRAVTESYFEFGEYATIELEIDAGLNVVGGRVLSRD